MDQRQRAAIAKFSEAVAELKVAGVIRSDRYLGDVAEFLCADAFGIKLEQNLREGGHDGRRGDVKVQVKYGGGKKTNVDLGNPNAYGELYVVLGRGSIVRSSRYDGDFLVYKLTADQVRALKNGSGGYSCGGSQFSRAPDLVIRLDELSEGTAASTDL
jgi:hypothetical protein